MILLSCQKRTRIIISESHLRVNELPACAYWKPKLDVNFKVN